MRTLTASHLAILTLMTFCLLSIKSCVHAIFPSGATTESCVTLQSPGSSLQDPSTNPFPLMVYEEKSGAVVDTYVWNETLRVSIGSYPNILRGVLLQARSVGSTNAVGEFVNVEDGFQYLRCPGSSTGTITNIEDNLYYKLSFYWTSAGRNLGDIEFLATIGNRRGEYWTFGSGVIAVNYTEQPEITINCPSDIFVTSLPESNGNYISWSPPRCTNITGHLMHVTCNETNHQFATISPPKTVHCWCESKTGSKTTCDFEYTVQDITPPVIRNCPNDTDGLFFYLPNNQSSVNATWIEPQAFDNSGSVILLSQTGGNNGDHFSLGTTTISYTFTDSSENRNQCIFNVTVLDNLPPVVSGCEFNNTNMYQYLPRDQSMVKVTWVEPFATDNSAMTVEVNRNGGRSGDYFTLGTTNVEYIFTDKSGNSAQCVFNVTVLDITPPVVIDCGIQNGTKLEADLPDDASTVAVSWLEPNVTDNSGGEINVNHTGGKSGDMFPLGITIVRYVFTDESGNINQCVFYIDVKDSTPPNIICPQHNEVLQSYLPPNGSKVNVSWVEPYATDNSGEDVEISSIGGANGDAFPLGTTNITYTFTDKSGNNKQCTFHVLVLDITPPIVTDCDHENNSLVVYLPPDDNHVNVTWTEPTATDNSEMPVIVTHSGRGSGDFFPLGTSTVRYNFTDSSENSQYCVFDVLVLDDTPPAIRGCEYNGTNMYQYLPHDQSVVKVTWVEPFATDNSAMTVEVIRNDGRSGDFYTLGTTYVEYIFTDKSGNSAQCVFNVTVIDITPPVVTDCGIQNGTKLEVDLPDDASTVAVSWLEPNVTDNSGEVNLNHTGGKSGDMFPMGTTTVRYVFTDESGNSNQCVFYIEVKDRTPPNITCTQHNQILQTYLPANGSEVKVTWTEPYATDKSGEDVEIFRSGGANGDLFSLGATNITYTFTDKSGNSRQCVFQVLVLDVTPPIVTDCDHEKIPLVVYLPPDDNHVNVTWTEPTATDNSGMPVVVTHSGSGRGDPFSLGRSTVRYTFTDSSENSQYCVFDVLVVDTTPPEIVDCPNDIGGIEGSLPSNGSHAIISWRDPVAKDNSGLDVKITISGGRNGGEFYLGKTEITYTFTDSSGNINQCIFDVTVTDITPPEIVDCPNDIQVSLPFNSSTAKAMWETPSVVDNSGDAVRLVQSGGNSGDLFPLGVTTIIYKFLDSFDNYNQCDFDVIVRDVTEPVISACPILILASTCGERESVAWLEPTAIDNSNRPVLVKASENPEDVFTVGNHTVIYTFEDESGNTALCSFVVQVEMTTAHCTNHVSYIAFVAIGFYLFFVCLAIALCVFLLYRRKRNAGNYTISHRYETISEPQLLNSTAFELSRINHSERTAIDDSRTFDGAAAAGGVDSDLQKCGYMDLEKSQNFYHS